MKNDTKQLTLHLSKRLAIILPFMLVFLSSCQTTSPRSESVSRQAISVKQSVAKKPITMIGQESLVFDSKPDWMLQVEKGNSASKNKDWYHAALFYNRALDLINDTRSTPQAPSHSQIEEIIRLASHAQMLASNGGTRSIGLNCAQMMRDSVRGIEITKHLMPVEFKTDKTTFTKKGAWIARQLSNCLIEKQKTGLSQITLVGHTDDRGSDEYNDRLSRKRANALKSYLKEQGIRISIFTEGRGEREPLQNMPSNLSQSEIYQLNRRVEVRTD
jgi:outer membrane protein OmpA-like peptidoglycan-associated protein